MNKKGMLGNLIMGFIIILIGVSLVPTVFQQVSLAMNCNQTLGNNSINATIPIADTGSTNLFGGGGSEHFGGYNNQVVHENWMSQVGQYSIIQTNQSILGCIDTQKVSPTIISLVTLFFVLAVSIAGISITFSALRTTGAIV